MVGRPGGRPSPRSGGARAMTVHTGAAWHRDPSIPGLRRSGPGARPGAASTVRSRVLPSALGRWGRMSSGVGTGEGRAAPPTHSMPGAPQS